MKRLPDIPVDPFVGDFYTIEEVGPTTPYSMLFRSDTRLTDVLDLTLDGMSPDAPLTAISAGCSYGAEIDSILGTIQYNSPRPTTVLGFDVNPKAVEAAKSGTYQLVSGLPTYEKAYSKVGIDFYQAMAQMHFSLRPNEQQANLAILDTNALRQQHQVEARTADLTHSLPTEKLAHVVMCNNVLYHLKADAAEGIVGNLAQHVAPNGILSLGTNPAKVRMEANLGMSYPTWLQQMGAKLGEQGLKPALFNDDGAFAFRRM